MPPTDKKQKAGQQTRASKGQLLTSPATVYDVTVKDCLVWPSATSDPIPPTNNSEMVYVSLRSQKDQRAHDGETRQLGPPGRADNGHVIDALRGWPRAGVEQGGGSGSDCPIDDELPGQPPPPPRPIRSAAAQTRSATRRKDQLPKAAKGKATTKSNKRVVIKEPEDVHVGDLIQQRFLHEYIAQREAEQEAERLKKEKNDQAAIEGRRAAKDRRDIKANKAAQLRSIALADSIETSPMDLWKMEKFTKAARPHLSTFRNKRTTVAARGQASSSMSGCSEHHGPCTCADPQPYYYGNSADDFCSSAAGGTYDERDVIDDYCNTSNNVESLANAYLACAL